MSNTTPYRVAFISLILGILLSIVFLSLADLAWGQEGTMLQSIPIPCERGTVLVTTFDTNDNPADGGEYHVYQSNEKILMEMWYELGPDGGFVKAKIGDKEYASIRELPEELHGPCDLLRPKVGA